MCPQNGVDQPSRPLGVRAEEIHGPRPADGSGRVHHRRRPLHEAGEGGGVLEVPPQPADRPGLRLRGTLRRRLPAAERA